MARLLDRTLLIAAVLVLSSFIGFGQGFSAGSSNPPSVNQSDLFITIDGRFSIALPQDYQGFTPVSSTTPAGRITGDSYDWSMKEGRFTAGYIDRPEVLEEPNTARRMLDYMRDTMVERAKSKEGKLFGETSLSGLGHPGRAVTIDFPDGRFIQRVFLVEKRMYLLSVVLHKDQLSQESTVKKTLDTFRILSPAELEVAIKKRIADATPSPLPQTPLAPRAGSDAADEGLKGKVKTVLSESEDLSGTWAVGSRKPDSMSTYDEQGNETKTARYDWKGNISGISVYGYLDGNRVSRSSYIRHEYDPPPMFIPAAPGQKAVERDTRYDTRYNYTYDAKGRLVERLVFGNDGKLRTKCVHEYDGAKKIESCYSDGKLYYKATSILDERGNEIEQMIERPSSTPGNTTSDKYSYTYEFDAQQNWIKKTTSKWVTKDGRSFYQPSYTNYRTITYY